MNNLLQKFNNMRQIENQNQKYINFNNINNLENDSSQNQRNQKKNRKEI